MRQDPAPTAQPPSPWDVARYLAEMLAECKRMATEVGLPFSAHMIGVAEAAIQDDEQRLKRERRTDGA